MPISIRRGLIIMPPPIPNMPPKKPASSAILGNMMNALGPIKSHSSGFIHKQENTHKKNKVPQTAVKYCDL